ncbi:MAG: hypothetical protein Q8M95_16565 [Candidatus Methanoperedens sp.]|nr:hypothetical protein [Candidatus Methanoperedens sp.]
MFLLISTNLAYADVECNSEKNGTPTKCEIIQYLTVYLQTYNGLVENQKDLNTDQFFLYNKTFLIDIIIANYDYPDFTKEALKNDPALMPDGQVAFIFNKVEYDKSISNLDSKHEVRFKYRVNQTNRTIDDILFHRKRIRWLGANFFYRDYKDPVDYENRSIKTSKELENSEYFYYVLQNDFRFITPEVAVYSANDNYKSEYRDLLVQKARKIAEENSSYNLSFFQLFEHYKLMKEREDKGEYLKDIGLLQKDEQRFDELANNSGLSRELKEKYRTLPVPKKEIFGFEYENNFWFFLIFISSMIFATIVRVGLNYINNYKKNTKLEQLEKYFDMVSLPSIAVYFSSIIPFDLRGNVSVSAAIILIFLAFTFFVFKKST